MEVIANLFSQPWYVLVVATLLTAITAGFFIRFVLPAWRLGRDLSKAIKVLASIKKEKNGNVIELDEIARDVMTLPMLSHLCASMRRPYTPRRRKMMSGRSTIVRWRATAVAASSFTEEAIVATPLKAEFYKHLPGILTGLGIIGTFSGLISGLVNFDVSLDPTQAQRALRGLVTSVGHAFYVSAAAISLAMLFTWIEKSLVTARYRQVEELRQLVDGLFVRGRG